MTDGKTTPASGSGHLTRTGPEAQAERLQMVLEGTRLGMWDWNPQTNEVVFDERWAQMLGHELDEIPFELDSWASRVHPDDMEQCHADLTRHMQGEVPFYENVHRMRHKDGHWVHILDRGRIMERDADGNPTRFTGTHTDITAQREAEFAAQAANRAKSSFLANMSHEIRTPLNAVLGFAQLLLRDPDVTPTQAGHLEVIRRSGDHLLGLINDVLTMSRVEAGHLDLDLDLLDLGQLVDDVAAMGRPADGGIDVQVRGPAAGEVVLLSDPAKVRQVLVNLVGNAVKFTVSGTVEVVVDVRDRPGGTRDVTIEVHDDGPGIPEGWAEKVFDTFDQTDAGRRAGGAGLGLAISRQFAGLLGGDLRVIPSHRRGAGFRFTFGATAAEVGVDEVAGRVLGLAPGQQAPDVLVVDDNALNRAALGGLLRQVGCVVHEATDGADAITAVRAHRPDLVFMDVRMPRIDGIAAVRHLKADDATRDVPVVMLSASALDHERDEALDIGAAAFIAKPFREQHVLDALADHAGVQWQTAAEPLTAPGADAPTAQRLREASGEQVLEDLRGACAAGDVARIDRLAGAIADRDAEVAAWIRERAAAFDHDALLRLATSAVA